MHRPVARCSVSTALDTAAWSYLERRNLIRLPRRVPFGAFGASSCEVCGEGRVLAAEGYRQGPSRDGGTVQPDRHIFGSHGLPDGQVIG